MIGGKNKSAFIEGYKKTGADLIVGTPGRIQDLIESKAIDVSKISVLVLDETDKMMDMNFQENIQVIYDDIMIEKS
jgi:superfamily II DNA/RNA helicase